MRPLVRQGVGALVILPLALVLTNAATERPGAGSASAGEPAALRQTGSLTFTEQRPGRSSEVVLTTDYVNPDDPSAKPPAVRRTEVILAEGAKIDTSAPELCTASDAALIAQGAAACPAGSRVGGGSLRVDTGFPSPARHFDADVTLLNNANQLIFLSTERSTGARVVSRSVVEGRVVRNSVPVLPGTPPDGGALDRQEFTRNEITRRVDGETRSYITTPERCPPEGFWLNEARFYYADGVVQTLRARSPCRSDASGGGADRERPRVRLTGVPRRACASRDFTVRVAVTGRSSVRVVLLLDGRRLRDTRRRTFDQRIRVARLRPGVHRLTARASGAAGDTATASVRFRRCASRLTFTG